MKFILSMLVLVFAAILACGGSSEPSNSSTLSPSVKELAIESIKGYSEVFDAAITEDGRKLSLVVIVGCATSDAVAKDMGDNFVRMVKSFGPEPAPTKEIGKGDFDYLVGVYCAGDKQIALGAKNRNSTRINW